MRFSKYAAMAAACLAFAGASAADEIRTTSAFGANHVMATAGYPALFAKLSELTDGRWTGHDTPSGLLAPNEMNAGLRDGISEMGPLILPYFAADYPESGIVGELSILGTDNRAIASAVTEYLVGCAECQAEFARNGQVYLGSDATTNYQFISTRPIRTAADMGGVRIRTAGAIFTRLVESLGGEPVPMPSSEQFEALNSGVIDAAYAAVADLINMQLFDVITSVTMIDQGVFNAAGMTNASSLLWMRMTPEDRKALAHASQFAQTLSIQSWIDKTDRATEMGKQRGIEFIIPDDSLKQKAAAFRAAHLAALPAALSKRGVTEPEQKIARYQALLAKWEQLVVDIDSPEQLAELRYDEIWSKIDYTSYGQ